MSNPSKQKGTAFEREVVDYLRSVGFVVERRVLEGANDRGDVSGIPGWCIEAKNCRAIDLAGWSDECERERVNDGAKYGLLVVRRKMKSIEKAYAIQPLHQAVELISAERAFVASVQSIAATGNPIPGYMPGPTYPFR